MYKTLCKCKIFLVGVYVIFKYGKRFRFPTSFLIRMLLQKLFHPIVKVVGHDMNPADVVVGGSASAV